MKSSPQLIATTLGILTVILLLSATTPVAQDIDRRLFTPVEIGNKWVYQNTHFIIPPDSEQPLPGELLGYLITEISRDTVIAEEQYLIFDRYEYDADFNLTDSEYCVLTLDDDGYPVSDNNTSGFCGSLNSLDHQYSVPSICATSIYPIIVKTNETISISDIDYTVPYTHECGVPAYHGGGWTLYYAWDIGLYHWLRRQPPRYDINGYELRYSLHHAIISDQEYGNPISSNEYDSFESINLDISVYPNPATTYITISLETASSDDHTVTIFDIQGRTVISATFDTGASIMNLPVEQLGSGTYIVRVMDQTGNQAVRLLTRP